jgi:putative phosphoribosyl transferase
MEFLDRRDAGRRFVAQLLPLALEHPVVIALPRGGVPVGFEVATTLEAPLDLLAVRKLGAPGNDSWELGEPPETYPTAL